MHEYDVHHVHEDQSIFNQCITSTPNTTFNQGQSTSLNCFEYKYSVLDPSQPQDDLTVLIQKNIDLFKLLPLFNETKTSKNYIFKKKKIIFLRHKLIVYLIKLFEKQNKIFPFCN